MEANHFFPGKSHLNCLPEYIIFFRWNEICLPRFPSTLVELFYRGKGIHRPQWHRSRDGYRTLDCARTMQIHNIRYNYSACFEWLCKARSLSIERSPNFFRGGYVCLRPFCVLCLCWSLAGHPQHPPGMDGVRSHIFILIDKLHTLRKW